MSPFQLFCSLVVIVVSAFALTCNYGGGGLGADLVNKTCLTNVTNCFRLDYDFPNGTLRTSWYDCDTGGTCNSYAINSNNSFTNSTGYGYIYCCNSSYCNIKRSAVGLSLTPAIIVILSIVSMRV